MSQLATSEVEEYFSSCLGAPTEVSSCQRTFPGMSRETYLVRARVDTDERGFVLRVDPPGGGMCPVSLRQEYDVYERLHGSAVPVAEPLWFDESEQFFDGRPRMVRVLVEGSPEAPADNPQAVADAYVSALAAIHTLPWKALGLDEVLSAPRAPSLCAMHELERWWALWLGVRREPDPELTRIFHWLREQAPDSAPTVALLKGNNGVGEELWREGRIVAMSDWELASIGDPASDLAFAQGVFALGDESKTIRAYETAAGFTIDRHNLAWYRAFNLVVGIISWRTSLAAFVDGRDRRPVLAACGVGGVGKTLHLLGRVCGMPVETAAEVLRTRKRNRGD